MVTIRGTGSVASIGLNNRVLGGGDWFYNSANGAGQQGIKDASGANNIGHYATDRVGAPHRACHHNRDPQSSAFVDLPA